jgi:dipeptide transport system ATP-binding protein
MVPGLSDRPSGCLFAPRCGFAFDLCRRAAPVHASSALGRALCHTPLDHGRPQPGALLEATRS